MLGKDSPSQTGAGEKPKITVISPTAQAVEMAKADLKREGGSNAPKQLKAGIKRKVSMRGGSSSKKRQTRRTGGQKRRVNRQKKGRKTSRKRKAAKKGKKGRGGKIGTKQKKSRGKNTRRDIFGIF